MVGMSSTKSPCPRTTVKVVGAGAIASTCLAKRVAERGLLASVVGAGLL